MKLYAPESANMRRFAENRLNLLSELRFSANRRIFADSGAYSFILQERNQRHPHHAGLGRSRRASQTRQEGVDGSPQEPAAASRGTVRRRAAFARLTFASCRAVRSAQR